MAVIDHDWLLLPDMHSEIIVANPEVLKIERGKSNLQVRSSVEKRAESLLTVNSKGANKVQVGQGWALSFANKVAQWPQMEFHVKDGGACQEF